MQFIVWTKEHDTGIPTIDAQHRKLIDLANNLYEAIRLSREEQVIQNILEGLTTYMSEHFAAEEALLKEAHYPEYDQQVEAHRSFIQKFQEHKASKDFLELSDELFGFLKKWIVAHFLGMDKRYVPFLSKLTDGRGNSHKNGNKNL